MAQCESYRGTSRLSSTGQLKSNRHSLPRAVMKQQVCFIEHIRCQSLLTELISTIGDVGFSCCGIDERWGDVRALHWNVFYIHGIFCPVHHLRDGPICKRPCQITNGTHNGVHSNTERSPPIEMSSAASLHLHNHMVVNINGYPS